METTITLQSNNIPFNSTPCLLGVLLNRNPTFTAHIDKLNAEITSKLHAIKAVSHSTWGWKKSTLKTMLFAYICSKMDYAAPAWQPWLSNTNMARMESFQNYALHIATSQFVSTPVEALQMEANVPSKSPQSERDIPTQLSRPSKKNCFQSRTTTITAYEMKLPTKSKKTIRNTARCS